MQTNAQLSSTAVSTKTGARTEAVAGAVMAAVLGLVMVWGVGFSQAEAFHNTAHDTRHANAFPCH